MMVGKVAGPLPVEGMQGMRQTRALAEDGVLREGGRRKQRAGRGEF